MALALAAPTTYDLLSTATLPPLSLLAEVLAGLLAGSVALAKAVHGDNVHLELHKWVVGSQPDDCLASSRPADCAATQSCTPVCVRGGWSLLLQSARLPQPQPHRQIKGK